MSGIAGILRFDGHRADPAAIGRMTGAMAHRGPDGIGHWSRDGVALGQCMLRTTPESLDEVQPLANEDESLVLVMDGRVDNRDELERDVSNVGARLRSRSDAELVLRAYEAWDRECVTRIEGDFALVVWDASRRVAFCARDRMGNKPFYYHWNGKALIVASEIHPILNLPEVGRDVNEGVLAEYLAAEWYALDETLWKHVIRLPWASRLEAGTDGLHLDRYWGPVFSKAAAHVTEGEHIDAYRRLFSGAVRRQARSQASVACEVSGGLDSSAIFAVADRLAHEGQLPAPGVDGFTLDFHDDPDADELEYSRAVGAALGRNIQEVRPARMPLSWYRETARRFMDFPSYPNGIMGLSIRAAAREQGSRVLLVGVGGDEWIGGSRAYYADCLAARRWGDFVKSWKADASEAGAIKSSVWLARHGIVPLLPHAVLSGLRRARRTFTKRRIYGVDREAWLSPSMKKAIRERRAAYCEPRAGPTARVGQQAPYASLFDAFSMMARESEERLCSAEGLELRRPYWDVRIVEHRFATPEWLRLTGRWNKHLHRRAMRGLLPDKVVQRESKADFMVTFRWHLRGMRRELTEIIPMRRPEWIDAEKARSLYNFCDNPRFMGWPEWMLWTLFACDAIFQEE